MAKTEIQILKEERAKIKEAIMNLEEIKSGFNLAKYQLVQVLKRENHLGAGDEELMTALAELIREGKLPGSSVISSHIGGAWQVVVQSFGTGQKIRLRGSDRPLEITPE